MGRVTSGDASEGKLLFTQNCGSCHTLADAKTQGTVGPNLDDAFAADKQEASKLQTIRDVIRGQIAYPDPAGPMKPNLVTGTQADDVAWYVAQCSGNPSCGVTAANPTPPPATTTTGGGTTTTGGGTTTTAAGPDGKQVFAKAGCGGCHTLKDAGSTGTVGPNLDALKPSQAIVAHQVTVGGGAMPSFKGTLTPAEIQAVATYVSSVAG